MIRKEAAELQVTAAPLSYADKSGKCQGFAPWQPRIDLHASTQLFTSSCEGFFRPSLYFLLMPTSS